MNIHSRYKNNIILYIISMSLISFATGIFLLAFNLHISVIIDSKVFISNFLLVGNASMAVGGIIFGRIIDKYKKNRVLLLSTVICGMAFCGECIMQSQLILYALSVIYGLGYSVLMSIHTPFIMEYVEEERQPYIINLCSSIKLFASTCGTFIGGLIPLKVISPINNSPYQLIFILAGSIYLLGSIPLIFCINKSNNNGQHTYSIEKIEKPKLSAFSLVFLILGLLIFFSPYMNLYFNNRYNLNLRYISIIITIIEICPVITNVLLSKLFKWFKESDIIIVGSTLCAVSFFALSFIEKLWIQIILFLLTTIISSFLFPQINRFLLKLYPENQIGKMSGYANFFYNIGDSIGTYSEGLFINYGIFSMPFLVAAILYIFLIHFIKNLHR